MSARAVLAATIVLALASVPRAQGQEGTPSAPVIVTTGEAVLTVAPDRAFLQIAAEGRASKAADAQRLAADAMTSLQAALKGLGLPADAVKTTGYTLAPENDYVNGRQTFKDYLARNQIEVRVDDLGRLSAIIDAAGASGASVVSGLRFDVKNRESVEQAALKQAVADAMARATAIAAGANRTVGGIVRIVEQRMTQPVYRAFDSIASAGRGGGAPTPVEPGEVEVRAQVSLTVAIK